MDMPMCTRQMDIQQLEFIIPNTSTSAPAAHRYKVSLFSSLITGHNENDGDKYHDDEAQTKKRDSKQFASAPQCPACLDGVVGHVHLTHFYCISFVALSAGFLLVCFCRASTLPIRLLVEHERTHLLHHIRLFGVVFLFSPPQRQELSFSGPVTRVQRQQLSKGQVGLLELVLHTRRDARSVQGLDVIPVYLEHRDAGAFRLLVVARNLRCAAAMLLPQSIMSFTVATTLKESSCGMSAVRPSSALRAAP